MRRRNKESVTSDILKRSSGLRSRIDAHCVSCTYDELSRGTWRQQIEACAVTECSLHSVRPCSFRKRSNKDDSHINSKPVHCEVGPKIGSVAT